MSLGVPFWVSGSVVAISLAIAPASAKQIASHGVWTAHETDGKSGKVCYLYSLPEKKGGDVKNRGEAHVYVTHRPREKVRNEISIAGGYTYKDGATVAVDIDGKKFELFTRGPMAWARDANMDTALVRAMTAGKRMIVRGSSSRGGNSTDTYALVGFGAAYKTIGKACGVE
jgi:Invasion associated locus B (IalB) protein